VFQAVDTPVGAVFGQVARAAAPSPPSPPRSAQQEACFLLMAAVCVKQQAVIFLGNY